VVVQRKIKKRTEEEKINRKSKKLQLQNSNKRLWIKQVSSMVNSIVLKMKKVSIKRKDIKRILIKSKLYVMI